MPSPIITLITDFGLKDPYVAEMKAVILGISPNATIIDITHEIEKFNVRAGAYILASAAPYFPRNTIHVAVIDPGVGTKRRSLLIETRKDFYIGPDNGLLTLAAKNQDIKHIYEITNEKLMLPRVSGTFHGRDIFAPAAAHLANGELPAEFGPEIHDIVMPEFAKIIRKKDMLVGEVIHIDGFGNIITNFGEKEIEFLDAKKNVQIQLGKNKLKLKFCRAYAEVDSQKPLAVIGSHNFFEIAINQGNAAEALAATIGDKVTIYHQ